MGRIYLALLGLVELGMGQHVENVESWDLDWNGIFDKGEKVVMKGMLQNDSADTYEGSYSWSVSSRLKGDKEEVLVEGLDTRLVPGLTVENHMTPAPLKPGFYYAELWMGPREGNKGKKGKWFGVEPEAIEAPLTKEEDFEQFWSAAKAELEAVKPEFKVIAQKDSGSEKRKLFLVEMRSLGKVRVRGWYEVPAGEGPYPVMLRVPGYGGNMKPLKRYEDLAVFSFNPRGHGNSQDEVSGKPENYWIRGLEHKKSYFYRGAFMDCLRAVDFLASRPEIDQDRIAVTGESQGGGLSLATAALDARVDFCAPDIPFLADWVRYFKLTKWPEMDGWIAAKKERSWESTLRTMSYFDTMNLAPDISCPVLMSIGLQDKVCPAVTCFAIYNRLGSKEKDYLVYPDAGHGLGEEHQGVRHGWLRKRMGLGEEEVGK